MLKCKKCLWVSAIFLLINLVSTSSSNALDPDWEVLNKGEVQAAIEDFEIPGEGIKKRGVAMVILPANVEIVWKIASNWDKMKDYVPNLKYYKTVYKDKKEKFIAGRLKVLFFNIDYPLWVWFDSEKYTHTWRLLKDDELPPIKKRGIKGLKEAHFAIKDITGYWEATPIDENNTLFFYTALVETKIPVPSSLEAYLSKLTLPNYLKATRQYVIDHRDQYQAELKETEKEGDSEEEDENTETKENVD